MLKHAAVSSFLSQTKDRFHVYNQAVTPEEKFQMIDKIKGIDAVEIVYPYEVHDPAETKALIDKYGVKIAAVNVNIKAEPEFINGGITSSDPLVRARAVGFIKEAKDFAVAIGADKVTCCPLGDGYEFHLQVDYIEMWNRIIGSFREAGEYFGDFPLFIKFKPSETRGRCFIDDAAKTMAMIQATGRSNLGVPLISATQPTVVKIPRKNSRYSRLQVFPTTFISTTTTAAGISSAPLRQTAVLPPGSKECLIPLAMGRLRR